MPRTRKATTVATSKVKTDLFKTKDIKEDVLIDRVISQAGVRKDDETTGFVKSVLPRFADASPRQAFSSMSKMVREFGRGTGASAGANQSNAGDGTHAHAPSAQEVQPRRRPGRPKKQQPTGNPSGNPTGNPTGNSGERAHASSGEKRRPGRPKGSKNRVTTERPQQ